MLSREFNQEVIGLSEDPGQRDEVTWSAKKYRLKSQEGKGNDTPNVDEDKF